MSYSRTYTETIHVHGTVQAHYPKSDSGGTTSVSYDHSEPVSITIAVDTDDFDHTIGGCNTNIDLLTGAVVGMNSAQCLEIRDSADRISSSIVNGFFGMIKAEVSQQMTDLKNRFESQLALLQQIGKNMGDLKKVMGSDFSRISARYGDIFKELDSECYRRIYALDSTAFSLSGPVLAEQISGTRLSQGGAVLSYNSDIQSAHDNLVSSRMRKMASSLVSGIKGYLLEEKTLNNACESITFNRQSEESQTYFLPFLILEKNRIDSGDPSAETTVSPPESMKEGTTANIADKIIKESESGLFRWVPMNDEERSGISSRISELMESSPEDSTPERKREQELMMALWESSRPCTLEMTR